MTKTAIVEFKFLLVEELVCSYDMNEHDARHAVQNSVINKMLGISPDYVMRQALEYSAEEVWKEYKGVPIEV